MGLQMNSSYGLQMWNWTLMGLQINQALDGHNEEWRFHIPTIIGSRKMSCVLLRQEAFNE